MSYHSSNHPPRRHSSISHGIKKAYIDPSKFINSAAASKAEVYIAQHNFEDFNINPLLKTNLRAKGYLQPSPIQDQAIIPALEGRDIIGVADTGTGKTAAFALPLLHKVMLSNSRALIIAPTRELAQQINADIISLAHGSNLRSAVLIGGAGIGQQLRDLRNSPQVVVGTPGRIQDHMDRRSIKLSTFSIVVLDEVDRMLDMGFLASVRNILQQLNPVRQSFFFSATLDTRVKSLIETFSKDPLSILVKTSDSSANINQNVVKFTHSSEKITKLHDLLISKEVSKVIIFDDTQRGVERLSNELIARGFRADSIHGGKSQGQRQRSLSKFKHDEVRILVATDVAARGIDVPDVTHVINYSQPNNYSDYIHRIGRAGRAGKVGYALTFING